ncbi:MAG: hypothetical protein HYZ71_04290 [Deltaproteobacteria bacterium]|nr:hypothetical protein [Deltaproteobacteria bacterium]
MKTIISLLLFLAISGWAEATPPMQPQTAPGGEVGGNGEDLSAWVTSIGYEILDELYKKPVDGISHAEFQDAIKNTKLIFVTTGNREELEKTFGVKLLVNPFNGPVGPKVHVIRHKDEKFYMFLDYGPFEGLYKRSQQYGSIGKDYRSLAHGYVLASGKADEKNYAITAKAPFAAIFAVLEARGNAERPKIKRVNLSQSKEAITLVALEKKNAVCLGGDLENYGIIPYLFHSLPKKPFRFHHFPTRRLDMGEARLTDYPRWRVSMYSYTQLPIGVPAGTVRPGSPHPIYYNATFSLGNDQENLRFCAEGIWNDERIPVCLRSAEKMPFIQYGEIHPVYDAIGNLLLDKTLVAHLSIAHEELEEVGFLNGRNPTQFKASLGHYNECLRKALGK